MSDFLHRLQERITAAKNAKLGLGPSARIDYENGSHGSRLSQLKNYLMQAGQGKQFALPTVKLKPDQASKGLTSLLMIVFACTLTYWAMRIIQVPGAPSLPALGMSKGVTLYSTKDGAGAYGLFGSKPLVTDTIQLRGVVITSKLPDGHFDGFAIFEIDGKPTGAISVGENLGKGLTLQSIGDESATLLYEGQKLDFTLSKAGGSKK